MTSCCQFMENLFASVGEKGFSAVVQNTNGELKIRMQFRSGNGDQIAALTPELHNLPESSRNSIGSIAFEWQVAIKHCPSCGTRLDDWIRDNHQIALDLAESHKQFILG